MGDTRRPGVLTLITATACCHTRAITTRMALQEHLTMYDGRGPAVTKPGSQSPERPVSCEFTEAKLYLLQRSRAHCTRKDPCAPFYRGWCHYHCNVAGRAAPGKTGTVRISGTTITLLQRSRALKARKDGVPLQYRWNHAWRAPARGPYGPRHICLATIPSCT